jgi:hypothetical protein
MKIHCLPKNCFSHTPFYKLVLAAFFLVLNVLACTAAYAQTSAAKQPLLNTLSVPEEVQIKSFPAGSLVLMANGSERKIETIQAGELVAAYDPVLEDYIPTEVTNTKVYTARQSPMASVMLILEDLSASLQANGGLAGVSLQGTANCEVYTRNGPKQIRQLTDTDLMYCYDENAHRFLIFRVYDVVLSGSAAETSYTLQTAERNFVVNSTVVLQTEEL